jgi:hypothetical protein
LPWLTLIPTGKYTTVPDLISPFFLWAGINALASLLSAVFHRRPGRIVIVILVLSSALVLATAANSLLWFRITLFLVVLQLCTGAMLWGGRSIFRIDLPYWAGSLLSLIAIHFLLFALALTGHFRSYAVVPLFFGISIAGAIEFWRSRTEYLDRLRNWTDSLDWPSLIFLQGLWFVFAAGFVTANAPETYSDAARFHVPYMMNLVRDGAFTPNYSWYTHLMPAPLQLLGAGGYLIFGEAGSKWFTWYLGMWAAILLIIETRSLTGNAAVAFGTGFVFISIPFVWLWLTTSYQDLPTTVFCLAGFAALRRSLSGIPKFFPVAAVFFGFAFVAKIYSVLFFAALLISYFIFEKRQILNGVRRSEVLYSGIALAVTLLPWHILVWYWTDNPVFPFFNTFFDSPYISPALMDTFQDWYKLHFQFPYGFWDLFLWPWSLTFESISYVETPAGSVGFLIPVLFPIALLGLILPQTGTKKDGFFLFAASAIYICFTILLIKAPYLRFWLPGLALLLIFFGFSIQRLLLVVRPYFTEVGGTFAAVLIVTVALVVLFGWGVRLNLVSRSGLAFDLYRGELTRDHYLEDSTGNAYQFVNRNLRDGETVLTVNYPMLSTIRGFSMQIMPWYDPVIGLHTLADYDRLIRGTNARYWIVRSGGWDVYYQRLGVAQKYWSPKQLVFHRGGYSVYQIKP